MLTFIDFIHSPATLRFQQEECLPVPFDFKYSPAKTIEKRPSCMIFFCKGKMLSFIRKKKLANGQYHTKALRGEMELIQVHHKTLTTTNGEMLFGQWSVPTDQ